MKVFLFRIILVLMIASGFACTSDSGKQEQELLLTGNPAIDGLTQEISKDPQNAELYAERARIYGQNEGFDEAIADLEKAIELDSLKLINYYALAELYLNYYQSLNALKTMEKAVELFPDHLPSRLKLAEYQLILRKHQDSMNTLGKVFERDAQNAEAFFWYAMNLKDLGKKEDAVPYFQKAVENDPELVDAWINLGQIFDEFENPIATQYFDSAIEMAPEDATVLHAKATHLQNNDKIRDAIECYKSISRIDPQYEAAYFNRGMLYLELDSIQKALNLFDITTKVRPTHVKAYFYRGLANELLGKKEDAKANYEQVLNFDPDHAEAKSALKKLKS